MKADKLVEDSRVRAQKLNLPKLPRVNSDLFLAGMLDEGREVISAKDREKLEKKYKEIRQKTRESLKKLSQKWEEECVLSPALSNACCLDGS